MNHPLVILIKIKPFLYNSTSLILKKRKVSDIKRKSAWKSEKYAECWLLFIET